jgi:ATP-binding protein involved in chromosome partitioning
VPLLASVPLTMPLREQADAGVPLAAIKPDDPAAQAVHQAARGIIALTPAPLPILNVVPAAPPAPVGLSLPMAG